MHWRRQSGCLVLEQPPHRKELYFRQGHPFFARSTMKSETLGRYLLNRGLIDADAYERATLHSIQERQKLGEALVSCGALTQSAMDDVLLGQSRDRFVAAFSLRQATFSLSDELPAKIAREEGKISMLPVLREGIARYLDLEFLTSTLASWVGSPIQRTSYFTSLILSIDLLEEETRLVGAIDGTRTIGDLMSLLGIDGPGLFRTLFLLRSIGMVRGDRDSDPEFELTRRLAGATGKAATAPPGAAPSAQASPAEQPSSLPAPLESGELLVEALIDSELLPVHEPPPLPAPVDKKTGAVTRSFGFVRHDEEVEVEFAALPTEDADARPAPAVRSPAAPAQPGATPPRGSMVQDVIEATRAFTRGETALAGGDAATAVASFEAAVRLNPGEGEYQLGLGLARYLAMRKAGSKVAPELDGILDLTGRALARKPRTAKALALRSLCLRDLGRADEAEQAMVQAERVDSNMRTFESSLLTAGQRQDVDLGGKGLMGRAKGLLGRKDAGAKGGKVKGDLEL